MRFPPLRSPPARCSAARRLHDVRISPSPLLPSRHSRISSPSPRLRPSLSLSPLLVRHCPRRRRRRQFRDPETEGSANFRVVIEIEDKKKKTSSEYRNSCYEMINLHTKNGKIILSHYSPFLRTQHTDNPAREHGTQLPALAIGFRTQLYDCHLRWQWRWRRRRRWSCYSCCCVPGGRRVSSCRRRRRRRCCCFLMLHVGIDNLRLVSP